MRNTPYPRFTIGHRDHGIFDLSKATGLIQGITALHDPDDIKVSALQEFSHLRPGELKEFANPARLEVVEFGGHHARGGFVSTLKSQVVEVEAGGRLKGPIAWRIAEATHEDAASMKGSAGGEITLAITLVVLLTLIACLSIWAAVSLMGILAAVCSMLYFVARWERHRTRVIERMGSVYILAPDTRTWVAPDVSQAA
ncbi:hypothetical protein [Rhizobium sp. MHM7A]|uniref:hypothetical protein n=1 Tax=Rhizobium sp. MHM7A TaxID=2583233 RepID=UPI001105E77C|nr:hypothetical protein [Rhizobium sp. MHM7A]TLX16109.1 hypothetical protein FFR93_01950 [Rhizobium sp. MHM7A]